MGTASDHEQLADSTAVAVRDPVLTSYPSEPPFSPSKAYPEYPFSPKDVTGSTDPLGGRVYELVRSLLLGLHLDAENAHTPAWNPFGRLITPGDAVLLKPNLVRHYHLADGDVSAMVTHASFLRPVIDYVLVALQGTGTITIGDAPIQDCDWPRVLELAGITDLLEFYSGQGIDIALVDFRSTRLQRAHREDLGVRVPLAGDPAGYATVDLGCHSRLVGVESASRRFRVTRYDPSTMGRHHGRGVHEYSIAGSVLAADVIINLPKLKTHRKAGLTACLKNLVGINGDKDWLPHHRQGSRLFGGDEYRYPDPMRAAASLLTDASNAAGDPQRRAYSGLATAFRRASGVVNRDRAHEGSWYGNDTIWRTALDLNAVLLYAREDGSLAPTPVRRVLHLVDAVVAGDVEGPLMPRTRPLGLALGGSNPVAVDAAACMLVGFDYRRIPLVAQGFAPTSYPLTGFAPEAVAVETGLCGDPPLRLPGSSRGFDFRPPTGWAGHIELR